MKFLYKTTAIEGTYSANDLFSILAYDIVKY